jgi:O-antigen/teichoic acid export membrane protein
VRRFRYSGDIDILADSSRRAPGCPFAEIMMRLRLSALPASLAKFSKTRRSQTMLDQLVVSGSNFVTSIILVRGLGLADFGKFTVAYALLLLANSFQLSFISSPMLSLGALFDKDSERNDFLRGMYGVQVLFCAVAAILALIAAAGFLYLRPSFGSLGLIPAFAAGVALFLLQDWLRRYYFTIGKARASLWNDVISYLGQVLVLLALRQTHTLTVATALWSIALTSGIAFTAGAVAERLSFSRKQLRDAWMRARVSSRDLAIATQLQWFVYQGAMLIGAGLLGAQAAGGVRATQSVVGPVNVAFQAMETLVPLRAGEEMRRGGIDGAARFLFRFGRNGFVALLLAFLALSFFSRTFLGFAYGRQVGVYSVILDLQMLYFLLAWPIRQFTFLFRTLGRTIAILGGSAVAAAASLILIYPMVRGFSTNGIMLAAVAGQLANLLYIAYAWKRTRAQLRTAESSLPTVS